MKKLRFISRFVAGLFIFAGCQDVVQVKLDEGSDLYVIDAFLESQYDAQAIFIHKNSSYFNSEKPEPVTNALVTLYDLTANISYLFYYSREDRYEVFTGSSPHDSVFQANHQYRLEVVINGDTYSAMTTQPRAAKIDSIGATRFTQNRITGQPTPPYYMCTLWAKDKVDDMPDYYWIKTGRDSDFINLCIDGTGGIVKNAGVDSLYFTAPYNLLGFPIYLPNTSCRVEVDAISRDTYNFLIQAQAQISNGGLFATTPENVKTNFISPKEAKTKAVGWFSVASVAVGQRQLPG
jgi:uncharacterized protein DUF4249